MGMETQLSRAEMGSVVAEILRAKVSDCCRDLASQIPVHEN